MAELVENADELHASKLSELRNILNEEVNLLLEDWKALKFLAARQFHVDNAATMVNEWAKWWTAPINHLTEWTPKEMCESICVEVEDEKERVFREHCPHSFQGEDMEGSPIFWEKLGVGRLMHLYSHNMHDFISMNSHHSG